MCLLPADAYQFLKLNFLGTTLSSITNHHILHRTPSVQDVPAESLLDQYLPDLQKLQDVDTFIRYYCSEESTLTAAEIELLTKSDQAKEERVKSAVEAASIRGDEGVQKFIRALRLAVGEGHDLDGEQLLKRLEVATGLEGQQETKQQAKVKGQEDNILRNV